MLRNEILWNGVLRECEGETAQREAQSARGAYSTSAAEFEDWAEWRG